MRFTQHYAGCTVCAPSRCSLLTGKHTGHAAIRGNKPTPPEGQWPIPADSFTVGKLFQQAGHRTACIGKKGYQPHPTPRAAYAAMITRMDRDVGRLMALLKDSGLDGNTLVIFTSDNGPTFVTGGADSAFFKSAGPYRGLKESPYEGGIRIPFIGRWPGHIKAGTTSDLPSAFWDLLPTCADLLGNAPPADTDGLSFLPTLLGRPGQKKHDYFYWEWVERGPKRQWQCLREGDWKAIRFVAGDRLELYNLADDPGEKTDVAARFPDVAKRLRERMKEVRTESADFPMVSRSRNSAGGI